MAGRGGLAWTLDKSYALLETLYSLEMRGLGAGDQEMEGTLPPPGPRPGGHLLSSIRGQRLRVDLDRGWALMVPEHSESGTGAQGRAQGGGLASESQTAPPTPLPRHRGRSLKRQQGFPPNSGGTLRSSSENYVGVPTGAAPPSFTCFHL